jgi:catechol-2,3-dioxygenase
VSLLFFKHQGDFVMEPKFAVIALWADDVVKVAHFYRDVLRLKPLAHHDGSIHFVVDGTYLVIREGHVTLVEASKSSRFPLFAIAVDDLDDRTDNLQKHDVALPWGIESNETSRWIMFNDPAGNLIELVQFHE